MVRNRVLSFMSQLSSGGHRDSNSRTPSPPSRRLASSATFPSLSSHKTDQTEPLSPVEPFPAVSLPESPAAGYSASSTPIGRPRSTSNRPRSTSRPLSIVHAYQPFVMDINDTIPELQPIFTHLNSHGNKLYHEGYFFKLDDHDTQGRPNADRNWTECFAQLVGTVMSLWDATELDAAGEEGEVLPKFINLTDASIKVIDSLPMQSSSDKPLQHILSVSTAGRNRYLLHFNSHHAMIQWTAAIRLTIFEHSILQEAYTGALIAGKGKMLNNINLIMSRARFPTEGWVRVRFGAGVPWRRCWCVVSPPDEKELQKQQKQWKKRSAYDRSHMPVLKGDIKFFDTRKEGKKQKKAKPIATVTNAFNAYAIYPQAKALIDVSTLIKLEGAITIHSVPPSTTEGFVFMMPEVQPAVTGFEMLLRFLFPIWDTFGLYGRPGRLVASVLDPRSLMFGMPKRRRYGYLEVLDVANLVATEDSASWTEREWRRRLREQTAKRMTAMEEGSSSGMDSTQTSNRSSKRFSSVGVIGSAPNTDRQQSNRPKVGFADDDESQRVARSLAPALRPAVRNDSAPPSSERQRIPSSMKQARAAIASHARNFSDTVVNDNSDSAAPAGQPVGAYGPTPDDTAQAGYYPSWSAAPPVRGFVNDLASTPERISSEDDVSSRNPTPPRDLGDMPQRMHTPEPVRPPPAFHHSSSAHPATAPQQSAQLRRAKSRLSSSTLAQIISGGRSAPADAWTTPGDTGPTSRQGKTSGNFSSVPQTGLTSSSSAPSLAQDPTPSNTGNSPFSKSPLNQTLAPALEFAEPSYPHAADGQSAHRTAHLPSAPSPYYDAEPGRQMLLAQGPVSSIPSAPSACPPPPTFIATPGASSQNVSTPQPPQRLQTPPPQTRQDAGASPLSYIHTSPPVHRKPLPSKTDTLQRSKEASESQSSAVLSGNSSQDYHIDEAALAKVRFMDDGTLGRKEFVRQDTKRSEASSKYDDTSSSASLDYASAHESVSTQEPAEQPERPRAGVLRTVGDATPPSLSKKEDLAIPDVDFGPTINYAARPVSRNKTPTPFAGSAELAGAPKASSPAQAFGAAGQGAIPRKAPRDQRHPSDSSHYRQESDDTLRRSVPWQPGGVVAGSGRNTADEGRAGAMTPEQFVMQRAAQASTPLYAHRRNPSNNTLAAMGNTTPSPTIRRRSSLDMLSLAPSPQFQQAQRPSSQGATSALGNHSRNGSGDPGSHLSAREQEHLARMTGAPLINMATNARGQQAEGGPGLVGAIAAREREKQQMKEGYSSQAVQYAINQRQQAQFQQQQQQYYQQQQQLYGYQPSPSHGPPQPWPPQMGMGPMQNGYASQTSWNNPQQQQPSNPVPGAWPTMYNAQQNYPQGVYGQSYNPAQQPGARAPRSRTPGPSGRGPLYPGQAF